MVRAFLFSLLCQVTTGSLDSTIVATVGRFAITGRDLLDSYEFGPAFVRLKPQPLRAHLEYMIYERLIALEAEHLKEDTSLFVGERLSALQEDLAVDELYKDEVLSKVSATPDEIELGTQKARTNIRLRWIFADNRDEANRIAAELQRGVPFDSLFAGRFDVSDDPRGRMLEITLLQLERNNPELADHIVRLRSQEVSAPINAADGYYIVRMDEIWQNPILKETDHGNLRTEVTKVIETIYADRLAQDYIRSMMAAVYPLIKAEGFNTLRAHLAEKGLSRDTRLKWNIPSTFMTEAGPFPLWASGEFLNRTLVTFGDQTFTVRDYLRWFEIRQFQLDTRSIEAFNSSVKRTIWKMVQDKLLSQQAYARGLHLRNTVQDETRKWEAKLLYLAGRSRLLRAITIGDPDLQKRYAEQKHRYVDGAGKQLSFGEARQHVWVDLYSEEETKVLHQAIQRLRNDFPVTVREDLVLQLASRIEKESAPINVFFYKPGGTFPRVAFPTIDEAWQRFD